MLDKDYDYKRKIVCAAIRAEDRSVLVGIRHYSADMHATIDLMGEAGKKFSHRSGDDQGFVDTWGTYHTRAEAYLIASKFNQIINRQALSFRRTDDPKINEELLYSECLY